MCYNHANYVIEALDSVKNQTYENIEILINDDFSEDNSKQIINEWIKTKSITKVQFNKENIGNTKSFNNMLNYVKGDFVIDFATDDILQPNAIEIHIENFYKNNFEKGVSFGNVENIDENGSHLSYHYDVDFNLKVIELPIPKEVYIKMLSGFYVNACSMMVSKNIFDEFKGYDEDLWYEDLDFILRVSRFYPFFFADSIILKKRKLESSLGSQLQGVFNKHTYKLSVSTHKIFRKAIKMNLNKNEDEALISRIEGEIKINLKSLLFLTAMRNIILLIQLKTNLK